MRWNPDLLSEARFVFPSMISLSRKKGYGMKIQITLKIGCAAIFEMHSI